MFKVILLICAASVHPSDCQANTALDVFYGPDADNEITCGLQSQAYLAGTAIGRALHEGEYPKILCTRTAIGKSNVG